MGTEVFKRGVASILLVFGLVFSMVTFTPLASSGDWVNRPAPGGEIIEVVQGDNFLIRHRLEWSEPEDGAYTVTITWDCHDNHENENFTFLGAEAYFDLNNDNIPDPGLDPILAVVKLGSAPSPDYPGSTRHALSVKCPADNKDSRNGQFNVDITLGAYGVGGVPHIAIDNHPTIYQFAGIIIIEPSLQMWNRAPTTIRVLPPVEWQLVENWTGTIRTIGWKLIETWTGIIEAPANWELMETLTGTVEAPTAWQLIETWTWTVQAPAEWQLIETWTGTIEVPTIPEWQLIETWTGTIEAPYVWGLIETWTGSLHHYLVEVTTEPATDIMQNSATLNASIDYGNFSDVDIRFQYRVQGASVWENTDWTYDYTQSSYSDSVSGLSSSTTHEFRGHIQFDSLEDFGDISEFTTLTVPSPPPSPPPPSPPPEEVDNVSPPAPSLISPADNENTTDNTLLLDWSDVSDPSGVTYDLSIAGDAGFTSIVLQKTDLTASGYELTSAEALAVGTYYWRVRGVDEAGNVGSWSENWSFRLYVPPKPALTVDIPSITTDENATIEFENTAITEMTIVVGENVENVRIAVQQLTDKPTEIAIGAPGVTYAYLNIVSENITDADIDMVLINFRVEKAWIIAEDVDPDSIVMRRWDSVAEVWVSLPTERTGEDDIYYYYYQAESPGLSVFGIGYYLPPAHAEFEFSNLMINPSEVRAGKVVTISVVVANVGNLRGSYNVILKIDNTIESAESVTLAGGTTRTVTFTVSSEAEGTHDIEVEGLVGTFVVIPAPSSIIPLAITGGIVLLAGILIWLRSRRTRLKRNDIDKSTENAF